MGLDYYWKRALPLGQSEAGDLTGRISRTNPHGKRESWNFLHQNNREIKAKLTAGKERHSIL